MKWQGASISIEEGDYPCRANYRYFESYRPPEEIGPISNEFYSLWEQFELAKDFDDAVSILLALSQERNPDLIQLIHQHREKLERFYREWEWQSRGKWDILEQRERDCVINDGH